MVSEGSSCFPLLFSGSCLPSFNSLIASVSPCFLPIPPFLCCFSVCPPHLCVCTNLDVSICNPALSPPRLSLPRDGSLCLLSLSVHGSDQHSARACLRCFQRHHVPHAGPPGHEGLGAVFRGPPLPTQGGAQPLLPREAGRIWGSGQPGQRERPRNCAPWPRPLPPAPPPGRPRGFLLLLCDWCCALPHPGPHPATTQVSPWEEGRGWGCCRSRQAQVRQEG